MKKLTHVNETGKINMVDVTGKSETIRECSAVGKVYLSENTYEKVKENKLKKGDVLTTAKLAGIMAAKKTWELIPLCHNIPISNVEISIVLYDKEKSLIITSIAKTRSNTGIEMEALTSVSIAALTIYDMCKSIDHDIVISDIQLTEKRGGKSGSIKRNVRIR